MKTVIYTGPYPEGVHVHLGGGVFTPDPVKPGESFTTSKEHADSLLEQEGHWKPAPKKRGD